MKILNEILVQTGQHINQPFYTIFFAIHNKYDCRYSPISIHSLGSGNALFALIIAKRIGHGRLGKIGACGGKRTHRIVVTVSDAVFPLSLFRSLSLSFCLCRSRAGSLCRSFVHTLRRRETRNGGRWWRSAGGRRVVVAVLQWPVGRSHSVCVGAAYHGNMLAKDFRTHTHMPTHRHTPHTLTSDGGAILSICNQRDVVSVCIR